MAPPACLPLCVSCHIWRVPSAELGLELLHDQEDDHHSRHDAAKVRPEAIVQRHGALLRVGVRVRVTLTLTLTLTLIPTLTLILTLTLTLPQTLTSEAEDLMKQSTMPE